MRSLSNDDIAAIQYMYSNPADPENFPLRGPTIFQSIEEAEDFRKTLPFQPPIRINHNINLIDPDSTNNTVTIAGGNTLKIKPDPTVGGQVLIACREDSKLEIYESFEAEDAVFHMTTDMWDGISISPMDPAASVTLKNCTIADATNGLEIIQPGPDVTIENTVIEHKFTVQLGGSGSVTVRNVTVQADGLTISAPASPLRQRQLTEIAPVIEPPPDVSKLLTNFPNPFNPETWIPYQLASDAKVTIRIYTATGQRIRQLELGLQSAGYYVTKDKAAYWNGRNAQGERVASGVYFYQIQVSSGARSRSIGTGNYLSTKKMAILK